MAVRLRLISWNIQHLSGGLQQQRRVVEALMRLKPDVVLLQECDAGTSRSRGANQAKEIAASLGMKAIVGAAMRFDGGYYGLATLTAHSVFRVTTLPVSANGRVVEPRILLAIQGPSLPGIANIHLSRNPPGVARAELLDVLERMPSWIDVLLGDMNHSAGDPLPRPWVDYSARAKCRYVPTWPSDSPQEAIDRVVLRGVATRLDVQVLREPITDHLPILLELELRT